MVANQEWFAGLVHANIILGGHFGSFNITSSHHFRMFISTWKVAIFLNSLTKSLIKSRDFSAYKGNPFEHKNGVFSCNNSIFCAVLFPAWFIKIFISCIIYFNNLLIYLIINLLISDIYYLIHF